MGGSDGTALLVGGDDAVGVEGVCGIERKTETSQNIHLHHSTTSTSLHHPPKYPDHIRSNILIVGEVLQEGAHLRHSTGHQQEGEGPLAAADVAQGSCELHQGVVGLFGDAACLLLL